MKRKKKQNEEPVADLKAVKTSRTRAYYPFSRDFPSDADHEGYRDTRPAEGKRRPVVTALLILLLVAAFCVAFTVGSVSMKISREPIPEQSEQDVPLVDGGSGFDGVKARFMSMTDICRNVSAAASEIKNDGFNCVITDVKTEDGRLFIPSTSAAAARSNAAADAPANAASAPGLLRSFGVLSAARISCFCDTLGAEYSDGAGIYADPVNTNAAALYTDASGRRWLSPYADEARAYIVETVKAAADAGFDMIILDNARLPYGEGFYPAGEKASSVGLNAALRGLVDDAKAAAGKAKLLVLLPIEDIAGGSDTAYGDGNMFGTAADGVAVDLRAGGRPKEFAIGDHSFTDPALVPYAFINTAADLLYHVREETGADIFALLEPSSTLDVQLIALSQAGITGYALFDK